MASTLANLPVKCSIQSEEVGFLPPVEQKQEPPTANAPKHEMTAVSTPSFTQPPLSRWHSAQKGGLVHTELLNVKQKFHWQLSRHKSFLNMALCIGVLVILATVIVVSFVFITTLFPAVNVPSPSASCQGVPCFLSLCESIPLSIPPDNFQPQYQPTYKAWLHLVQKAASSNVSLPIVIASQYWTMVSGDLPGGPYPTASDGEDIFERLKQHAVAGKEVTIVDSGNMNESVHDLSALSEAGANTYTLKVAQFIGNGILHTKSWLVGSDAFYLGSANMDFRALTEVKEMGVLVDSCPCLAADFARIHTVYLGLASGQLSLENVPKLASLQALSNATNRMLITDQNGDNLAVYLSSAPPQFSGRFRSGDVDAIVDLILTARHSISIEVMDYSPAIVFQRPQLFWPVLDDAIRRAAYQSGQKLNIRLLIGFWKHTYKDQVNYLRSLATFFPNKIEVKRFQVPGWNSSDPKIPPYSRVNHAKFLVTETSAWIGTSNWSGDYFVSTAGIGLVVRLADDHNSTAPKLVSDLQAAFDRDWDSSYVVPL